MKIILSGYMGSGKSTIGKQLAKDLSLPFFDLDAIIENHEKKTIKEIFSEKGEIYFRKIENQLLYQFVANNADFVLALGGGTPCYANNASLLQESDIQSVYLKASVETLTERLFYQTENRPLLINLSKEDLYDYIRKHLFDRAFYYLQSKNTIVVDDKAIDEIVKELKLELL